MGQKNHEIFFEVNRQVDAGRGCADGGLVLRSSRSQCSTRSLSFSKRREKGRLPNRVLVRHKNDYRDADAIGHRT